MPFAYTAVVVVTYGIGRGLYGFHVLTRTTLLAVYGLLAVMGAWLTTWWISTDETFDVLRSFALLLVAGTRRGGQHGARLVAGRGPRDSRRRRG